MNNPKKIILFGEVISDTTGDTVEEYDVRDGVVFHDADGIERTGTSKKDADTSDANCKASDMVEGASGYSKGTKKVGTIPVKGAVELYMSTTAPVSIPYGVHDGAGSVAIDPVELAKLNNTDNIAEGVTILGKTGTHKAGVDEKKQEKTVTPSMSPQKVVADPGFTCLSEVAVNAIPYREESDGSGTVIYIG